MLAILVLILIVVYSYSYVKHFTFWTRQNVIQASTWTAIKENLQNTTKKLSFMDFHLRNYRRIAKSSRYIGFYQFGRPMLMIRDLELIKQLTVKDRDRFVNRLSVLPASGTDHFWDSSLFALHDDKWRVMRSTLSPAFTANKMRAMFVLMDETAREFTNYFQRNDNQNGYQMKEIFRRFSADVIGNCAFGHKCNSLEERDNDFYINGLKMSNFSNFWKSIKVAIAILHKSLAKMLDIKVMNPESSEFFLEIVRNQLKIRQEQNIVRPDMLNLLLEARKGQLKHEGPEQDAGFATANESELGKGDTVKVDFTDIEITAQVQFFFVAGFDTMSSALSFVCYELALHPEIQERLREEVKQTFEECDGKLTYDALIGMKYMDMVISESLRKWPPALFTDRLAKGKYTIKKSPAHSDEKEDLVLDDDTDVSIPIYPIQNDPDNFPEPDVFDPERFSDENKKNIKPYSYMPFGVGPRSCIASRFALMELKVVIFHILHQYEIVPNAKTQIPIQIAKGLFNLDSADGVWLSFKKYN